MKITEFKKGDIITRVEPCVYLNYQTSGNHMDDRFIGHCITFLGCKNGMIYGTYQDDETGQIIMMSLPVHRWRDGWEFFIDPMSLLVDVKCGILNDLGVKLMEAEMNEDFGECIRLKAEIDKLKHLRDENPGLYPSKKIRMIK